MSLRQAAQQALEALEWNYNTDLDNIPACEQWAKMLKETMATLRAALAEPEQKPVAWINWSALTGQRRLGWECESEIASQALYTAPPQRKPLTDEQIKIIWRDIDDSDGMLMRFARAIEAAHGIGEKNHG
jgi:hypothetical protein